jgi:prephenate dehydrogenase
MALIAPPFRTVGIVGLGLIGGSIALRARATWRGVTLLGVDRDPVIANALSRKVIDQARASIAELADADVVVLAVPVPEVIELIGEAARAALPGIVTDVGSTKRDILKAAGAAQLQNFIGGHPMAGAERGGLTAARADLFESRPWLFVDAAEESAPVRRLQRFVVGLGARPLHVDAVTHDRTMAYLSHLPQLLAVALMQTAEDACGPEILAASGRAFRDMTRLASSPADLWKGILATNADFVAEAARDLVERLPASRDRLSDAAAIDELFAEANQGRARLDAQPAPDQ